MMKRTNMLPIGAMSLLLAFSACTDNVAEVQRGELNRIVMTASDFELEAESRTNFQITSSGAEFSWAANDTVGIFPEEGAQVYFPMTSGAGTKTANFTGGGWALKDASVYAAYYPMIGKFYLDKTAIPVDYSGQVQAGNASTAHLGAYDYMVASPSAPKGGSVNFSFKHLGALVQLKLTMPVASTLNKVTLSAEEEVFLLNGQVDIMSDNVLIESDGLSREVSLGVQGVSTTEEGQTVTLYMMLPPCQLAGKTITVTACDNSSNVYTASMSGKNLIAGKAYAFSAVAEVSEAVTHAVLSSAGTLLDAIGGYDNLRNIEKLKITGEINGDDVYEIRRMANLKYLDLKDAKIVEGGRAYYGNYTTKENEIGSDMFRDLRNFEKVVLPMSLEKIGFAAFYLCDIKDLTIFEGVKSIGNLAFVENDFTSIVLPQTLESVGLSAFSGVPLESLVIPSNVNSIGSYAFDCYTLKSVVIQTLPNVLLSIGNDVFARAYETATLYIPKGTKEAYLKTELGRFANIVEE